MTKAPHVNGVTVSAPPSVKKPRKNAPKKNAGAERVAGPEPVIAKRKKRRLKPGTLARREIRREQNERKSTRITVPKIAMERLVREVTKEVTEKVRVQTLENARFLGIKAAPPNSKDPRARQGIIPMLPTSKRWSKNGISALHAAAEKYLEELLDKTNALATYTGRQTIMARDVAMIKYFDSPSTVKRPAESIPDMTPPRKTTKKRKVAKTKK